MDCKDLEAISQLRELVKEKFKDKIENGSFDERDVERFNNDDRITKSYIRRNDDLKGALELVDLSLAWRKEMGINDVTEENFERFVWERGAIFYHNCDKDGYRILNIRVKQHQKKDVHLLPLVKKFVAYWLEKTYRNDPQEQIVFMFDMTGAGLANLDMDLIKFIINCFKFYYPTMLAYMLVFEMPWIFNAAWKIIKTWLSAEAVAKMKFAKKSDVQMYINRDQLLEHMGGTDSFQYTYIPPEERNSEESQSAAGKRVTFAEQDPTIYKSISNDSLKDEQTSTRQNTVHRSNLKMGSSLSTKRRNHDENSFHGRLLTISPAEELEFQVDENDTSKESHDAIVLSNTLPYSIAFKVKTTSPEKYKVKPSSGIVKPGSCSEVNVHLHQGYQNTVGKDRFLIMAVEVRDESTESAADLWKTVPKESVMEHRLRCIQTTSKPEDSSKNNNIPSKTSELVTKLSNKVDELCIANRQLEKKVMLLLIFQLIVLVVYVSNVLLQYFSQNKCDTEDSPSWGACAVKML